MSKKLENRYRDFLTRIGITEYHDTLWHEVEGHYCERHRHYHTLDHLKQMFDLFDKIKHKLDNPNEVEAAIWYHDVIYRTHATVSDNTVIQNEFESAVLANERLQNSTLNMNAVFDMILMTGGHEKPNTLDAQYFHDLDLSVLGADPDTYFKYSEAIRQEYSYVPDDVYARERVKILNSFLDREKTYQTEHFNRLFDDQSSVNMADEVAYLERVQRMQQKHPRPKPE